MIIILILFNKKCALYDHSNSDVEGINETKEYLKGRFVTKDLGHPKYYLGIEIAHRKMSISLSQRKYAIHLLQKTCLLSVKPVDTLMEVSSSFLSEDSELLEDQIQTFSWKAYLPYC